LLPNSNSEEISTFKLTTVTEDEVIEFLNTLQLFSTQGLIRSRCYKEIKPFLCHYIYPPCIDDEATIITEQNCTIVRDTVCDVEWSLAITLGLSSLLPVCENLKSDETSNDLSSINTGVRNVSTIACHEQFGSYCGFCLPLCGEFVMFNEKTSDRVDVVLVISAILAISGGIVVCIFAVVRRKAL